MRITGLLLILMTGSLLAFCPLGFPPDQACSEDSPSCGLYSDGNSDGACDNPEPAEEAPVSDSTESAEDVEEDIPDTLLIDTVPDTIDVDPETDDEEVSDSGTSSETEELPPEPIDESYPILDPVPCPLDFSPSEACNEDNPICTLYRDGNNDDLCDNPGIEVESEHEVTTVVSEEVTDSSTIVTEIHVELSGDSVIVDTVSVEEIHVQVSSCPLGFSPSEACPEEDPSCTLYTDSNLDQFCDNPGEGVDSTEVVNVDIGAATYGRDVESSGCPLGLPPAAACSSPENPLCPSYRGWDGCTNPSGGGMSRTLIVLIATALLLLLSTIAKRCCRGRRKEDRRKRKIVHIIFHSISLLVLGFIVQGCFCPLGVAQYMLLPDGVFFLGGLGIAVFLLPILWSAFFNRIYCGWVCPFGALQDLLGKLHVPRPPRFSHKVHSILIGFKYLLVVLFFSFIALISSGQFEGIRPLAFFCKYDPFHTIFSFFLVGSFAGAVVAMSLLVFFPRFFCKYLCFYGAVLSFLGRIGLWKRITRKHPKPPSDVHSREE